MGQYGRGVRSRLIPVVVLLAGCAQVSPVEQPTALPGPTREGEPQSSISVAGQVWRTCTAKQMDRYPPVLDEPAQSYYAGPWCIDAGRGTRYMWIYAEPLFEGETPRDVRGYVNEDARLLVRGLRTTGYGLVREAAKDADVSHQARRPTSPNLVTVDVLGDDVPPQGVSYSGDSPLRLVVAVGKAGPRDTPAPTP
jgi:hypothetical protein